MFCAAVRQIQYLVAARAVGVRHRSGNNRKNKIIWATGERSIPSDQPAAWSTGEVKHPQHLDCPLGNKDLYPKPMPDGGLQYFGFQYYPRVPGEEDAPCEPTPLHLVTRVKCLKKKPWWDKEIMQKIGLHKKRSDIAILKNTPEVNAMLWKVKHLVKVTPIRLSVNQLIDVDPHCCFLKENGEFSSTPTVKVEDGCLKEDDKLVARKWNGDFVDRHTRKNWEYPWQIKLC